METPKKWYNRWWFALIVFLAGLLIGWLLFGDGWMGRQSGINL